MAEPILLIGARGGVGAEVARLLVAAGERVIGAVRESSQIAEVQCAIPGLAEVIALDLRRPEFVRETLKDRFSSAPLGGVIVCAAVSPYGPLESVKIEDVRGLMDVNALACLGIFQGCMPAARRAKGRFVFVSSYSAKIRLPFVGAYQASKAALEALVDVMRIEGALSGVRISIVEPGGINTPMSRNMAAAVAQSRAQLPPDEEALYGFLYGNFKRMVDEADWNAMSTATQVAEAVIKAYRDPDPEPRYVVGADAEYLLAQREQLSDRQMDDLARAIYGMPPV